MTTLKTAEFKAIQLKSSPFIVAEVIFGSPKKNCAGIGICKVSPVDNISTTLPCRSVSTEIASIKSNAIRLRLRMDGLCSNLIDRQFKHGRFKMEEAFELPLWLVDELQLAARQIKAGQYPVSFEEEHIVIQLRLN